MTTEVTVDIPTRRNRDASAEVSPSQSLISILRDPQERAPLGMYDKVPVTKERELDGCSRLVPLGQNASETSSAVPKTSMLGPDHDIAQSKTTVSTKDTPSAKTTVISRGPIPPQNLRFLRDLLPTSPDSRVLTPEQQHRPTEDATDDSIKHFNELELRGSQIWTRLVSNADGQSTQSDTELDYFEHDDHVTDLAEEEQRLNPPGAHAADTCASAGSAFRSPQGTDDERGDVSAHYMASFPMAAAAVEVPSSTLRVPTFRPDGCADPDDPNVAGAPTVTKDSRDQVGLTMDHLVPRQLDRDERIAYLESQLEEAVRAECSRSVLVTKIGKLEAEVQHLRERSRVHQGEAVGWREQRQELRAAHSQLEKEFRLMVERCRQLEAESRQKGAMFAEAEKRIGTLEGTNSELEDALRHTNRLLDESQEERKRAWQVTSKSTEAAREAMRRADTASQEVETLRHEAHLRHRSQPPTRGRRRGSASDAAESPKDSGGPKVPPNGEDEPETPERTVVEHDGSKVRAVSPERGALAGVNFGLTTGSDSYFPKKAFDAWGTSNPPSIERKDPQPRMYDARPGISPQSELGLLSTGIPDSEHSFFSPSQASLSVSYADQDASLERRASRSASGDRERHDSERVRAALTGFTSTWAQSPVKAPPELKPAGGEYERDTRRESSGGRGSGEHGQRGGAAYQHRQRSRPRDAESKGVGSSLCETSPHVEGNMATASSISSAVEWLPFSNEVLPHGHRRHQDDMARQRGSLTGSRVCEQAGLGTRGGKSGTPEPGDQVLHDSEAVVGGANGYSLHDAKLARAGTRTTGLPEQGVNVSNFMKGGTASSVQRSARPRLSIDHSAGTGIAPSGRARQGHDVAKRGKVTGVPFATDTEDPGFQLVQQMERDLVALQMEISQLDMERARLSPKATKTIQGRDRMRQVRGRLESLNKEATGIRRKIREHKKPPL